MKVAELMSAQVATCSPEDSLSRAAQLMWERDCGAVVVIDGARRPVGMVTDRDICIATWSQERSPREIPVRAAMATSVVTCTHGQDAATVHTTLRQHQLHRLPVVDTAGALVGIVSVSDLIQDAARTTGKPREQVAEHVLETLGSVTRPRGTEPVSVIPTATPVARTAPQASSTATPTTASAEPARSSAAASSSAEKTSAEKAIASAAQAVASGAASKPSAPAAAASPAAAATTKPATTAKKTPVPKPTPKKASAPKGKSRKSK